MGSDNQQESSQASRELQAYVRKILGPSNLSGAVGAPKIKVPIPRSGATSREALTNGERASGGPRQLQAEVITRPSKSSSGSSTSFSLGNNWLLSPVAGVLNSILGLFGVGSSTSQVTRYRAETRQPFQVVEEISPETGAGAQTINESASGLFGVTRGSSPTTSSTPRVRSTGEASSVEVPAVKAERSARSSQSATRSIARAATNANWARRLTGSVSSPAPRGDVESGTRLTEGSTYARWLRKEPGSAGSTGPTSPHFETWANGIAPPAGGEGRSLMHDRQGLVSALRRSLSDSRGFSDVLNEFQDGL